MTAVKHTHVAIPGNVFATIVLYLGKQPHDQVQSLIAMLKSKASIPITPEPEPEKEPEENPNGRSSVTRSTAASQ